jgi:hypothetical protein
LDEQENRHQKSESTAVVSDDDYAIVKPIVKIQDALNDLKSFEQMKSRLLSNADYQAIQGKNFIKKSGWRKLALVFNISDEVVDKSRENRPDGSFVWSFRVRATAPNGRYTESVGSCDSRERRFSHVEHDVLATASTRAKSRAISDLIGAGEITAEELDHDRDSLEVTNEPTMESLGIPTASEMMTTTKSPRDSSSSVTNASGEGTGEKQKRLQRFELTFGNKKFPIKENEGPFTKFFINKIAKGILANNPGARFRLEKNDSHQVVAVVWENLDDEGAAKEIARTLEWTVRKVLESRKSPQGKIPT